MIQNMWLGIQVLKERIEFRLFWCKSNIVCNWMSGWDCILSWNVTIKLGHFWFEWVVLFSCVDACFWLFRKGSLRAGAKRRIDNSVSVRPCVSCPAAHAYSIANIELSTCIYYLVICSSSIPHPNNFYSRPPSKNLGGVFKFNIVPIENCDDGELRKKEDALLSC